MNQRLPKANLCCILEIKADNEPGISLPVYFKFVKKWKYILRKKHKTKQKDQKKEKKVSSDQSRSRDHRSIEWTHYPLPHDNQH